MKKYFLLSGLLLLLCACSTKKQLVCQDAFYSDLSYTFVGEKPIEKVYLDNILNYSGLSEAQFEDQKESLQSTYEGAYPDSEITLKYNDGSVSVHVELSKEMSAQLLQEITHKPLNLESIALSDIQAATDGTNIYCKSK
ncbi:MAG: hypothetical protein LBR25_03245 [Erysipelotrichaceae bacterium]|jgi:hypothetical protein|nr:hypothetical protein [Erysipelotrichaceae bacterium]